MAGALNSGFVLLLFGILIFDLVSPFDDIVKCPANNKCVAKAECLLRDSSKFLYPCHEGLNLVCCPTNSGPQNSHQVQDRGPTSPFPENCGIVITSDKISGGTDADLGQFPWMALLGYRQKGEEFTQFECGGSILNEKFILTAGHCIHVAAKELVSVRLGELNLQTKIDCVTLNGTKICADPYVDLLVDNVVLHPNYNDKNLENDIALVRVRQKITFTDFIKPICLPFGRSLSDNLQKQKLIVSGWGKTNWQKVSGSTILQFATVTVWDQQICARNIPPDVKPYKSTQLCANGPTREDACKGDSGGPLVNATVDKEGDLRYFQIGVVSFASTLTCGHPELPTVYTRVDRFLAWIEKNVL